MRRDVLFRVWPRNWNKREIPRNARSRSQSGRNFQPKITVRTASIAIARAQDRISRIGIGKNDRKNRDGA